MMMVIYRRLTCYTLRNNLSRYSTNVSESLSDNFRKALNIDVVDPDLLTCKTNVTEPKLHSSQQEGLFYKIEENTAKNILEKSFPYDYRRLSKAFNQHCLMVRKPALEVIDCLKNTNFENPVNRYIFFGKPGSGRSCSLSHVLHYAYNEKFVILHVPWGAYWSKHYKEWTTSTWKEDRFDMSVEALEWLLHFHKMNEQLIGNLTVDRQYTWSKREITEPGSPLLKLIDLAVNRSKYSCDIVGAVLTEIKRLASLHQIKVLLAIDGVNAFWHKTRISLPYGVIVHASRLSLVHNFKKMLQSDWSGGAVVCTVDEKASPKTERLSTLPAYLLTKEGFHFMEPFLPINVPIYSDKEMLSCLQYYNLNKWIQVPNPTLEKVKEEITFLSQKNPQEVVNVLRGW